MDLFTRDDLRALLANDRTPCASLLIRTTRGPDFQDKTRFRNALREAEERLTAQGVRTSEAGELLRPGHELINDDRYWVNVSDGLAGFLAPGLARFYRVPLELRDEVVVGSRFHVKPLVPLFGGEGRFYLLILDDRNVRLLRVGHSNVQEFDTRGSGPEDRPEGVFHGLTIAGDSTRAALNDYYHQVNRRLLRMLEKEEATLVLAGESKALEVYRTVNGYAGLLPEAVECNPSMLSPQQLAARAREVVQRHFQDARGRVAGIYGQALGTGRASADVRQVVAAAYQGHVQYLFADMRRECWGAFDRGRLAVTPHERRETGDEDLVNLAAAYTLINKGVVYPLEGAGLADAGPLAAVYRLPLGERASNLVTDTVVSGTGDARGR